MNANNAPRCTATVALKDGSTADCMRHRKIGTLCRQHAAIADGQSAERCRVEGCLYTAARVGSCSRCADRAARWPGGFEANGRPKQNADNSAACEARRRDRRIRGDRATASAATPAASGKPPASVERTD